MKQAEEVLSPIRTAITRARGPLFKFLTEGSINNTTGAKAKRVKLASTKKGIENFLTGSLLQIRPMTINDYEEVYAMWQITTKRALSEADSRENIEFYLNRNPQMSQVALAWQFKRGVAAPIVGATNAKHFDDAVKAVDLTLSDEDVAFVEAPYKAHEIVGAINANMTL